MSHEELQASRSEVSPSTTTAEYLELCNLHSRYLELARCVPSERRKLKARLTKNIASFVPAGAPGRPRQDALAEKILHLKESGKSWAQVGLKLSKSGEAVRKLAKSRRTRPPEKTPK
jgi:hypothetical protein